jgi:hypothetical protein
VRRLEKRLSGPIATWFIAGEVKVQVSRDIRSGAFKRWPSYEP